MIGCTYKVLTGDALDRLREMPDESVHCIVSSPPYYGLRDYGLPPQIWGGDPACEHRWQDASYRLEDHGDQGETDGLEGSSDAQRATRLGDITCGACDTCGAWRGSLGLEPTPELYVQHLMSVLLEALRVLREDGTLWLNLGDSYSSGGRRSYDADRKLAAREHDGRPAAPPGLPPKSLLGIPWRVALALQAAGATLRCDVIWAKGNPMPESVQDRPTRAHEYLFLFSKAERYFYDGEAIREPATVGYRGSSFNAGKTAEHQLGRTSDEPRADDKKRNKRSVWTVNTQPFPEAHFAVFPPELVRPCILAGTSERGCCARCGAPIEREVERVRMVDGKPAQLGASRQSVHAGPPREMDNNTGTSGIGHKRISTSTRTTGWRRTCNCDAGTVPCTVMDPFNGAGTTGLVALQEGRSYLGIELNPEYVAISNRRLAQTNPLFARPAE